MRKYLVLLLFLITSFIYSQTNDVRISDQSFQSQIHIEYDSICVEDTTYFFKLLYKYNIYNDFKIGNLDSIGLETLKRCIKSSEFGKSGGWKSTYVKFQKPVIIKTEIKKEVVPVLPPPIEIKKEVEPVLPHPPPVDYKNNNDKKSIPPINNIKKIKNVVPLPPIILPQNKATLTYVIKDTMMKGKTYTVDLTLSTNMSNEQIVNIIDGFKNKELIDTMITITQIMRARLLDPSKNFEVTSITDEVQNTSGNKLVRWQWQVVPINEGEISLTISVDNYINDKPQSVNIYNGKTYVYAIHTWYGDLWNWISKYWIYLTWTITGICAILAFLLKEKIINLFRRRDNGNQ